MAIISGVPPFLGWPDSCFNVHMDPMHTPDDDMTPVQVADLAKVSRATVSRALKAGDLLGIRDNGFAWHIRRADAEAWIAGRTPPQGIRDAKAMQRQANAMANERTEHLQKELAEVRLTLTRTEAESMANAARLADALADRDAWKAMAERLSGREVPIVRPVEVRRRLFSRLFGH